MSLDISSGAVYAEVVRGSDQGFRSALRRDTIGMVQQEGAVCRLYHGVGVSGKTAKPPSFGTSSAVRGSEISGVSLSAEGRGLCEFEYLLESRE